MPSDTSRQLLSRVRLGDASALGHLLARYAPRLRRWAHRRLPRWVRSAADTDDVVQDVLLRAAGRLHQLDLPTADALAAYLRQSVWNRIRDEHRIVARRGTHDALSASLADSAPSPLERAAASELDARYRRALATLTPGDQELLVGHIELDYTHEQLGRMTGRSRNAARMALHRAVTRLARAMGED
jgi:RNA polymerase sigma factor (sigma-70 family)